MNKTTPTVIKNRHLPLYEYLEILQIEYLSYMIRSKVYPIEQHRNYWKGAMENIKVKIEQISERNSLCNMFTDKNIETVIREKFYINKTPSFQYRNEEFRKKWEYWDNFNYYLKNSEVRVELESETVIGKIVDYTVGFNYIYVNVEGITSKYLITQVYRIL